MKNRNLKGVINLEKEKIEAMVEYCNGNSRCSTCPFRIKCDEIEILMSGKIPNTIPMAWSAEDIDYILDEIKGGH